MADTLGGLGGLFGGLSQGLQLLLMLRRAEEDRKLRSREVDIREGQSRREQSRFETEQADAPYKDIQEQQNKANVLAALPDIRREFSPAPVEGTYDVPEAQFPEFNAPSAPPKDPFKFGGEGVGSLDTSHLQQVLERASRQSMQQRKQGTLEALLGDAGKVAQRTQEPVAGAFTSSTGEQAELPQGFAVQPERTFQPYKYGDQSSPQDLLFRQLANDPLKQLFMRKTSPGMYRQFILWMQKQGYPLPDDFNQEHEKRRGFGNPNYTGPSTQSAPPAGVGTSAVPGSQSQRATTPNDVLREKWDRAAQALSARGQDPLQVLGPRPSAP